MRFVTVKFVRDKNHAWLMFRQNLGDDPDRRPPMRAVSSPRFGIDAFQATFIRHNQTESERRAGIMQFAQPRLATFAFAAERHSHVDDVPFCLAQQPQGQSANDAIVVRVRRENQNLGGAW